MLLINMPAGFNRNHCLFHLIHLHYRLPYSASTKIDIIRNRT